MISKELLSEVLGIYIAMPPIKEGKNIGYLVSSYGIPDTPDAVKNDHKRINIYELAHKCKEWAKNQGYVIGVDLDKVNIWSIKERRVVNHFEVYWEDYLEFEFKACEWIKDGRWIVKD